MINILFYFFFILLLLFLILILNKSLNLNFLVEWDLFFKNLDWELTVKIDWVSIQFSIIVFMITSIIIIFSLSYINHDKEKIKFNFIILFFIISIIILIFSFNFPLILLGWDGLGVTSFFLILYFHSKKSIICSFVTLIINRIGDLLIIFSLCLFMNFLSWITLKIIDIKIYIILFFVVALITKSAQFPFSFWLPAAIAAPTPVSSLVHSSTLVTAGVYVYYRFKFVIPDNLMKTIFFLAFLTFFFSCILAITSIDLKEIIAYSTMSQIGFLFISLIMRIKKIFIFHLCSHALFKAVLFMTSGLLIYQNKGIQNLQKLVYFPKRRLVINSSFLISLLSIRGIMFLSGFYSKDLILESFFSERKQIFYFFLTLSIALTIMYSVRILYYLLKPKVSLNVIFFNSWIEKSIFILIWFSIFFGSLFLWINFPIFFFLEINKNFVLILINLRLLLSIFIKNLSIFYFKKKFIYLKVFLYYFYYKYKFNLVYKLEKGWLNEVISLYFNFYSIRFFSFQKKAILYSGLIILIYLILK